MQYCECAMRSLGPEAKANLPALVKDVYCLPEQRNEAFYAGSSEWSEWQKSLAKVLKNIKKARRFVKRFNYYGSLYVKTSKRIGSVKLSTYSNQKLEELYREYFKSYLIYTAYVWAGFYMNELAATLGENILAKKRIGLDVYDKVSAALLSPARKSGILKLQKQLAFLKYEREIKPNARLISKLLSQYSWMPCLDVQNNPWTKKELLTFYRELKRPKVEMSLGRALQTAKLSGAQKETFGLIRELIFIKDQRDVHRRMGVYWSLPLYAEIGRRLGFTRKQAGLLTREEIILFLKKYKRPDEQEVKQRARGFAMYWQGDDIVVELGKSKAKARSNFKGDIRGAVASKGIKRGAVKIVLGVADLKKVKRGDVLVAITTHPDFVPAMQVSSAIVTDEGGLTSHAAIVSRELGIPCVVDTKIATKVLKDGDLVEVDANKGIVRKISK